jgi:tRNA-dihydrouridine synthase
MQQNQRPICAFAPMMDWTDSPFLAGFAQLFAGLR